jgi:hypothetical protein
MESQPPQLTEQEAKRLERLKRFGALSNPVPSTGEEADEVPLVLPPVKERITITKKNWR